MKFAGKCAIGCAILGIGFVAAGAAMGALQAGKVVLAETFVEQINGVTKEWSVSEPGSDIWDSDWEEYTLPIEKDAHQMYEFDAVKKIEADLSTDEIYFSAYNGTTIRVETDGDSDILRVKQEGDELKIKSLKKTHDCEIYVWYPEAMEFEEMELEVAAGTICLENTLKVEKMEIEVGAGELIAEGELITEETSLEVGAGTAIIEKMSVSKLEADCGVGTLDIVLIGEESEYCYKIECGIGSVTVGNETYEGLSEKVKVDWPEAKKELELECGMGEVTVIFEK